MNAEFIVKSYYEIRNRNVIRQQYEESCGAASIATLLNMIDIKQYKEDDILNKFKNVGNNKQNTDMVSFAQLQDVLNEIGYLATGYQISRNIFNKINIPIIVKIEDDPRFPHFVVVLNHKGDFVKIYDLSFGEYISIKSDFLNFCKIPNGIC
ncbi:cysteine peptidase family C39 domain-containing protein [Campylobacter hyointestinalis]